MSKRGRQRGGPAFIPFLMFQGFSCVGQQSLTKLTFHRNVIAKSQNTAGPLRTPPRKPANEERWHQSSSRDTMHNGATRERGMCRKQHGLASFLTSRQIYNTERGKCGDPREWRAYNLQRRTSRTETRASELTAKGESQLAGSHVERIKIMRDDCSACYGLPGVSMKDFGLRSCCSKRAPLTAPALLRRAPLHRDRISLANFTDSLFTFMFLEDSVEVVAESNKSDYSQFRRQSMKAR